MRRREFIALLGGAAVAWPLAAQAQQPTMPVIGFISWTGPAANSSYVEAFRAGLAEAGFIEGKNVSIEYRWANNNYRSQPDLAADLVRRQVAVIVAWGAWGPVRAAKAATSTIPIVFVYGGDPVKDGFVASFNRPGGNVTGITSVAGDLGGLDGKRLELLLQLVPQAKKVAFLSGDRSFASYDQDTTSMLAAGRALGVEIMIVECTVGPDGALWFTESAPLARREPDYEAALAKMVEGRADAMIVGTFALPNLGKVVPLAALHKLPTIYQSGLLARAGGLMSYGADAITMSHRLGGAYVARILKGERPADIPVEQPTKFELVINLWAAKVLGLTVPPTLLARADEVIE